MSMRLTRWMMGSAAAALLVGCGSDDAPVAEGAQLYEVSGTVIESAEHGPRLCVAVLHSFPPQCGGGFDVGSWDWDDVDTEEAANGTTWGEFRMIVTWDGTALTIVEDPGPPQQQEPEEPIGTPCPEPDGGWVVTDPTKVSETAQLEAIGVARADPGYAGEWLDQSRNPYHADGEIDSDEEIAHMNDPMFITLNARTTGDPEALASAMRAVWGGPVCVTSAERTHAELEAIQAQLAYPEILSAYVDAGRNVVAVTTMLADAATVADFDERFGRGYVEVTGWLQPYDGDQPSDG